MMKRKIGLALCSGICTAALSAAAHAAITTVTTLANFNGGNGSLPYAGVTIDHAGNLYGVTAFGGGAANDGIIYKIAAGSRTLSTAYTFTGGNDGANPYGTLAIDSAGHLYGSTQNAGPSGNGTAFKFTVGGTAPTTLATFNGSNAGQSPFGGSTLDASGNLYGTTQNGGANSVGIAYEIPSATGTSGAPVILASFGGSFGSNPTGDLVSDSAGNLYGTTLNGGSAANAGTLFKITAGTHQLVTLYTFTGNADGANPYAGVRVDAAGNLFGTTTVGGGPAGDGTVFELRSGATSLTTLVSFNGLNGANPYGGVLLDAAGNLFGTTAAGTNDQGTAWRIDASTGTLTTLYSFTGGADGGGPNATLTPDASGNLYGTASFGGTGENGTVFELTNTGYVSSIPEPSACAFALAVSATAFLRRRQHRQVLCSLRRF